MSNIKQPVVEKEPVQSPATELPIQARPIEDLIPGSVRTLSQSEIDQEASMLRLQTEKIRLEKEKLELEKLIKDVQDIRRKNENQRMAREAVQDSLAFERDHRIQNETYCTHMKGGDTGSMMQGGPAQGNDASNYAMIQHTLTSGVTFRMCQRCGKTWFPKDSDYRWAMACPTRNSPSTGCPSPGLVRHKKGVRIESEVPHMKPQTQNYDIPEYNFPNAR